MNKNHKIKVFELRQIIQDELAESYITEKFGEKIGNQIATAGVNDNRPKGLKQHNRSETIVCNCGGTDITELDSDDRVKCKDCGLTWVHLDEATKRIIKLFKNS